MIIHIEELTFDAVIGILDFERTAPQKVIVNCDIEYDYKQSFIDYSQVTGLIEEVMKKKQFELLETALTTLISQIKAQNPQVLNIFLKITKPDIIDNCTVSVSHRISFL